MKRIMSKLPLLATFLAVLLLVPTAASAAAATTFDGSKTQRLDLPDGLVGPESVAFDTHGTGPYVGVSNGLVLKYDGKDGWTTFAYSPSYTKNKCDDFSEVSSVARESSCGRPIGLRFHVRKDNKKLQSGYPDNVRPDGKGGYWVAFNREKYESPRSFERHVLAVRIDADGKKLQEMKGPKNVRPAEVVERDDGKIYLGSIESSYVGIINT
ncbi:unnamed protein product [Urochloa decumbens]|uniref:Uncharacterized protein n=1 Tax=Urochloa decumbens TaxID=240449 RepID=A0ABC9EYY0_9POAL